MSAKQVKSQDGANRASPLRAKLARTGAKVLQSPFNKFDRYVDEKVRHHSRDSFDKDEIALMGRSLAVSAALIAGIPVAYGSGAGAEVLVPAISAGLSAARMTPSAIRGSCLAVRHSAARLRDGLEEIARRNDPE